MKDVSERVIEFEDVSLCTSDCKLLNFARPVLMAALSKAWFCSRSLAVIAVSDPTGGIEVCLL